MQLWVDYKHNTLICCPSLLSIMFADAETFGVIPMSDAIPVAIPYAVANVLADVDQVADANL